MHICIPALTQTSIKMCICVSKLTFGPTVHTYIWIYMYEFMAVLLLLSYLKSQAIRQNLIRFNINLIYYMDFRSVSFNQCKWLEVFEKLTQIIRENSKNYISISYLQHVHFYLWVCPNLNYYKFFSFCFTVKICTKPLKTNQVSKTLFELL